MNGTLDGSLNQLNSSTHRHIRKSPVYIDGLFQADSTTAMIKKTCVVPFPGGRVIAGNFTYDTVLGGAYDSGEDFDTSEQKTDDQLQFFRRLFWVNVTMALEEVLVDNIGSAAVARNVDSKLRNAYQMMGSMLALQMYMFNNKAGYTKNLAGFGEAINDGTTNGWDATAYTSYGGLTRSAYNGALMPYVATLGGRQLEYDDVTDGISETSWGDGEHEPNVFSTTPKLFTSFKKRVAVMQRVNESTPVIGYKGYSIENLTVLKSRYCPGQDIATAGKKSNRVATRFLRTTSKGAITTYPSVSNETGFLLNIRKPNMHFHVSVAPLYQFGWTGWKLRDNNTKVSGQILFAGAVTLDNPSYFGQIANAA
jgi:hypothetical protein